jgi:hypothetical protein
MEDIGRRYGLTCDGARYRVKRIEKALKDGVLDKKLRASREVVAVYKLSPRYDPIQIAEERLPVRSISGARFSPLY